MNKPDAPLPKAATDLSPQAFKLLQTRVRELEEERDEMMIQADTDALTGLYNLRGFERRTSLRDWGWHLRCDLDGFKAAQDAHPEGHVYGDRILREFSDFLLCNTRQGEARMRDLLAGRVGGDEFGLWAETRIGARRIRNEVREWKSKDGQVTCSCGLGQDMAAADAACYINKLDRKKELTNGN